MSRCEALCTRAKCEELESRIEALEEQLRKHENTKLPDVHRPDKKPEIKLSERNQILTAEIKTVFGNASDRVKLEYCTEDRCKQIENDLDKHKRQKMHQAHKYEGKVDLGITPLAGDRWNFRIDIKHIGSDSQQLNLSDKWYPKASGEALEDKLKGGVKVNLARAGRGLACTVEVAKLGKGNDQLKLDYCTKDECDEIEKDLKNIDRYLRSLIRALTSDVKDIAKDLSNKLDKDVFNQFNQDFKIIAGDLAQHLRHDVVKGHRFFDKLEVITREKEEIVEFEFKTKYLGTTKAEFEVGLTEDEKEQLEDILRYSHRAHNILGGDDWFSSKTDTTPSQSYNVSDEIEPLSRSYSNSSDQSKSVKTLYELLELHTAYMHSLFGFNEYPATFPKDLTVNNDETEEIKNTPQFLLWIVKQLDALFGQFPIEIEISDSDLVKVGDQPIKLEFPNIAETLAELFGLVLQAKGLGDATLNASLRNLMETTQARQAAIKNYFLLDCMTEYLGYQTKKKEYEIELTFNPLVALPVNNQEQEESLEAILQNSKVKLSVDVSAIDKTLEQRLDEILEGARIIKAVHFRGFSPGNFKGEFVNFFKNVASQVGEGLSEEDFKDFLKRVEEGYNNSTDEKTKYWGRGKDNRPEIKQIEIDDNLSDKNNK